jgi:hypothetical protein
MVARSPILGQLDVAHPDPACHRFLPDGALEDLVEGINGAGNPECADGADLTD